ncbi:MAG TPA: choice-of-anchor tandem repeat GloVer-containing protein [Candidatus Acidoferrales bacterium]|jgi:uncharacterized repeat protein (TIGR03803 family)|nr:choice-of-anchor tandem repeat GloVer-containing protein [Candidatus Acidoferrales bacterium]
MSRPPIACLTAFALLIAGGCGSSTVVTPPNQTSPVVPTPTPTATPMPAYHLVYNFQGTPDGSAPIGGLIAANGVLYGTTSSGGANDGGTVFSVSASGTSSLLHTFGGAGDGSHAFATLVDEGGTLFGTTSHGGANGDGTTFAIGDTGATYELSYSFGATPTDGIVPFAGMTVLGGVLYGTTAGGGTHNGAGTVFGIAMNGSKYEVLHEFGKGSDGAEPFTSMTVLNGALYGTTLYGGAYPCTVYVECGVVFRIDPSGAERVLHSFGSTGDGNGPQGALLAVGSTLYGTTFFGGASGKCPNGHGVTARCGTVFRIDANGKNYAVLHSFGKTADGAEPDGSLIEMNGTLYGTTLSGGASGYGTIFSINPDGTNYRVVHSFGGLPDGQYPEGALTTSNGAIYGATAGGGTTKNGTVYSLTF